MIAHHRGLLPVRSDVRRVEPAEQAINGQWTSQELASAVRVELPKGWSGRKPSPAVTGRIDELTRAAKGLAAAAANLAPGGNAELGASEESLAGLDATIAMLVETRVRILIASTFAVTR